MFSVKLSVKDLKKRFDACSEGVKTFRWLAGGDTLFVRDWTLLHSIWLFTSPMKYYADWAKGHGLLPPIVCEKQDFSGFDFSDANFNGADFTECSFKGTSFDAATLLGADLSHSDLSMALLDNAEFRGADLIHVNLTDASLDHADFSGARLYDSNLTGASLVHAFLTGADLDDVDFSEADLSSAVLSGAMVNNNTKFRNAKLAATDLRGVINLQLPDFTFADLTGAYWPVDVPPPKGWIHAVGGQLVRGVPKKKKAKR